MAAKGPSVIITDIADLQGNITFGDGCVVHPGAFIDARGGTISFGENNIIEEKVRIVNKIRGKDASGKPILREMKIGSYNLFEAGCSVSSSMIGDMNEFGHKCFVDDNCKIGNLCIVGPKVHLQPSSAIADNMVAYDEGKLMLNEENTAEVKKPKMKELCTIQSIHI